MTCGGQLGVGLVPDDQLAVDTSRLERCMQPLALAHRHRWCIPLVNEQRGWITRRGVPQGAGGQRGLPEFWQGTTDQAAGCRRGFVVVGAKSWEMGYRVYSTNSSNPNWQLLWVGFRGHGPIVIESKQRSQLSPTGSTDHSNSIGIDSPKTSISDQLADRVPAVELLGRKMAGRAGPITDRRDGIPMPRQPKDGTVVAVNRRPVLTRKPDNQRKASLPAATWQKDVEALMVRALCIGNVAVVRAESAMGLDWEDNINATQGGHRCDFFPTPTLGPSSGPP